MTLIICCTLLYVFDLTGLSKQCRPRWDAWKKSKSCYHSSFPATSLSTRGHVYSSCMRSAMLHASETWPLTKSNLQCLQRNDRVMIRQICNIKPQDIVTTRSNVLLAQLGIEDLDLILKERRLCCYGHVCGRLQWCSQDSLWHSRHTGWWKAWARKAQDDMKQLIERAHREWKLSAIDPHDRHTWRSTLRSAMPAASQLSGRGPTDVVSCVEVLLPSQPNWVKHGQFTLKHLYWAGLVL